jgi:hypothetical protein
MPLDAGSPDENIKTILHSLTLEGVFAPESITDRPSAHLCLAGVWLLYDHLEACHRIAQELETREAAYWHAIMHRREGDFSNSKYWFRRVGDHPTFTDLHQKAKQLVTKLKPNESTSFLVNQHRWDPFGFVDLCEACVKGRIPADALCKEIQHVEWHLLFEYCFRKAVGW